MADEFGSVLTQLRKGVLEYCVLAMLQRGPSYGVDLAKRLGRHKALFASEGTLYPLLSRLRRRGWVESSWHESQTGPPRRYYRLTDESRAALAAFAAAWGLFSEDVHAVLAESRIDSESKEDPHGMASDGRGLPVRPRPGTDGKRQT